MSFALAQLRVPDPGGDTKARVKRAADAAPTAMFIEAMALLPEAASSCRWTAAADSLFDQSGERQMQTVVGGEYVTRLHHLLAAGEVGDEAASLAHQQHPRRDVPGGKAELPKAVEPAGGDIGEIERGRAEPPHAAGRRQHRGQGAEIDRLAGAAAGRQTGADNRLGELPTRRYSEPAVVQIGAGALLGPIHLVAGRLVDHPGDDFAVAFERDRDREMRDAVQKIGRAIEGIDDPTVARVAARDLAPSFEQEAVAGASAVQLVPQRALGFQVGGRYEFARPL